MVPMLQVEVVFYGDAGNMVSTSQQSIPSFAPENQAAITFYDL